MNTFKSINVEYIKASRSIETVLVSNKCLDQLFYIYNYEGNSYRVFESQVDLIHFFQERKESDFHFSSENELDDFLYSVKLHS